MAYVQTSEEFPDFTLIPRRGFTSLEATTFLRHQLPHVARWTCWQPYSCKTIRALQNIAPKKLATNGVIGQWTWRRIPISYPEPHYWNGDDTRAVEDGRWVGVIEVQGPDVAPFLLFSFLDSAGKIGRFFLASTQDLDLLQRFAKEVYAHLWPEEKGAISIEVHGGEPVSLQSADDERIFLLEELQQDIEQQVFSFFENKEVYKRLRVRHRRGCLFVGPPGTGKTMMLRRLIRQCYQRYKPAFHILTIHRDTGVSQVAMLFHEASKSAPAMVILEDMDSLTAQSSITRSALLAQLDGVGSKNGLLIIGTTNNAAEIDPALVHRPSRFDRVWHFPLPNYALRLKYLSWAFADLDSKFLDWLAEHTEKWSFAYLNELRTTAAILGINHQVEVIDSGIIKEAHTLLAVQFNAGRKNHVGEELASPVGFGGR